MSEITLDYCASEIAPRPIIKMEMPSIAKRWWSRHRLQSSIAHLDDRLLADVGLSQNDLRFSERLIPALRPKMREASGLRPRPPNGGSGAGFRLPP